MPDPRVQPLEDALSLNMLRWFVLSSRKSIEPLGIVARNIYSLEDELRLLVDDNEERNEILNQWSGPCKSS